MGLIRPHTNTFVFLNFQTPLIIGYNSKIRQTGLSSDNTSDRMDAGKIAKSENSDLTAPVGAV